MQLDAQTFLRLCEQTHQLAFVDIEATGLNGDYNSVLVVAIKPYRMRPLVMAVDKPGQDKALIQRAAEHLASYDCWVSYYGKGFDVPMLQSRLLFHGLPKLEKRHHVDLYYHLNAHVNTSRRSQAHRLEWLQVPEKKMTLAPGVWNDVLHSADGLEKLKRRCASDVRGLEGLYKRTRHLIGEVTR